MKKFSIIMPFYNRHKELNVTLNSFYKNWNKEVLSNTEIVIVEDIKNFEDEELHKKLLDTISAHDLFNFKLVLETYRSYNPCLKYNLGVKESSCEIIILTSPEIAHEEDIITFIDKNIVVGDYFVFDCASVYTLENQEKTIYTFIQWYEHPTIQRNYHFCSALFKEDFPGFNEDYRHGIAYDDDNFKMRVKENLQITNVHEPIVYHQHHARDYKLHPTEWEKLRLINENLWRQNLKENKF